MRTLPGEDGVTGRRGGSRGQGPGSTAPGGRKEIVLQQRRGEPWCGSRLTGISLAALWRREGEEQE